LLSRCTTSTSRTRSWPRCTSILWITSSLWQRPLCWPSLWCTHTALPSSSGSPGSWWRISVRLKIDLPSLSSEGMQMRIFLLCKIRHLLLQTHDSLSYVQCICMIIYFKLFLSALFTLLGTPCLYDCRRPLRLCVSLVAGAVVPAFREHRPTRISPQQKHGLLRLKAGHL